MLRHAVATLAYRGGKALRGAPADFAGFKVGTATRTPGQILAHLSDLLDWALSFVSADPGWRPAAPTTWDQDVRRFFAALEAFDKHLAANPSLRVPAEKLFQGPIADSFTHVGQIAMLRRLAGCPVRGENYFKAEIVAGRVGPRQAAPEFEFD
jgi:hypothetical protein